MPQVWTSLFDKGVGDDAAARASARNGIVTMINDAFEADANKILTSDKIVAFMARAFKDGWKDASWVFNKLDDAKKVQVRTAALCSTLCVSLPPTDRVPLHSCRSCGHPFLTRG